MTRPIHVLRMQGNPSIACILTVCVALLAFALLMLQGIAEGIRSIAIIRGQTPTSLKRDVEDPSEDRWEGV